jgi:ribonuclease HI
MVGIKPKGRHPKWFKTLDQRLKDTDNITEVLDPFRNKHSLKWKPSTEKREEIISIDQDDPYFSEMTNLHLEIDPSPDNIASWKAAKELIRRETLNDNVINFYTDGSLKIINKGPAQIVTMGAAWINTETEAKFYHKVKGSASSTNPESLAILSALEASPHGKTVNIFTDSQCAVSRLKAITTGQYDNLPIHHVLKIPGWQTWEAIRNIARTKNLTVLTHKVEAHTGDKWNEEADGLAKRGLSKATPAFAHNSSHSSRIAFALADRGEIIQKNPRKYLKHITQNVARGEWTAHYTSRLATTADASTSLDWEAVAKCFHKGHSQKSGTSSRKEANLRTYTAKLITGTLPTFKILFDKWESYRSSTCPRCSAEVETNDHVWKCTSAIRDINDITRKFKRKHEIYQVKDEDIISAIRGFPSTILVSALKARGSKTLAHIDKPARQHGKDTADYVTKALRKLIKEGRDKIWIQRNEDAKEIKSTWNLPRKKKNIKWKKPTRPIRPNDQENLEGTPASWADLSKEQRKINNEFDPYRCKCEFHSTLHSPGRRCDKSRLIINRAKELAFSADRRQINLKPLINLPGHS